MDSIHQGCRDSVAVANKTTELLRLHPLSSARNDHPTPGSFNRPPTADFKAPYQLALEEPSHTDFVRAPQQVGLGELKVVFQVDVLVSEGRPFIELRPAARCMAVVEQQRLKISRLAPEGISYPEALSLAEDSKVRDRIPRRWGV